MRVLFGFWPQDRASSSRYVFVYMTVARTIIVLIGGLFLTACHRAAPETSSAAPLRENVTRDAATARADTERGYQLIQSGHYTDAGTILKRAIEEDPSYGPAHNDLGIVHYQAERLYDAAWEFQNAIKLMPRQPQPHNNLGLVLESAIRFKEAEQSFTQAHELDPQNPEYAGNLARLRLRLGKRDEETRKLLEIVVLSDSRADWIDWARFNLSRLQTLPEGSGPSVPATRPAAMPDLR